MALSKADIAGANIDPEVKKLFLALIGAQAGGNSGMASLTGAGTVKMAAKVTGTGTEATDIAAIITALTNAGVMSAT